MPNIDLSPRIDRVLRHVIKRCVRRDWLDDAAFVLRTVITKGCSTIEFASQRDAATRNCNSNRTQHKSTPTDRGTEFVAPIPNPSLCKKSKTSYQRALEHENAKCETH